MSAAPRLGHALPVLSLDLDPTLPGVQSTAQLEVGQEITLDVVISGVDAATPLNAFQLEVLFDTNVLDGISVAVGPFLTPTVLAIQDGFSGDAAQLAATTLGPAGASGEGVLGSIRFSAASAGTASLQLDSVILSQPFGVQLGVESLGAAQIQVVPQGVPAVPEPAAALGFALGLFLLASRFGLQG